MKRAAIYHCTNQSLQRPSIYEKDIAQLQTFSESLGFYVVHIYIDYSIRKKDKSELESLLDNASKYDAIIFKSYFKISKNLGTCFEILNELAEKGIKIYSIEDGPFTRLYPEYTSKLKVIAYNSYFGELPSDEVMNIISESLELYVTTKTNWTLVDKRSDFDDKEYPPSRRDSFTQLMNNDFDVFLLPCFKCISSSTSLFFRTRQLIKVPIYSVQDGYAI